MARVGFHQLCLLIVTASPCSLLITTDKVSDSVVRRGWFREREPGGACAITPAGLRTLADEMGAGRVDDALTRLKKDVEARRSKRQRKRRG